MKQIIFLNFVILIICIICATNNKEQMPPWRCSTLTRVFFMFSWPKDNLKTKFQFYIQQLFSVDATIALKFLTNIF